MKKILMRSGMSPLDIYNPEHILNKNLFGGNVGNLIYQYSVYRALMTKDTVIDADGYRLNPNRAEYINENYDCYIIPLADAFRESFVHEMRQYTKLIKRLNIPVVVIGVGLSAPFEPKLDEGFPFDKVVKDFVSAVLEKSNIIGVRGQITADYLTKLGFREGIDHTVIGCPSMYTFGRNLEIRDTNINKNSVISVNSSLLSPKSVLEFITRSMDDYSNHYFIPQWRKEMKLTYGGSPSLRQEETNYPAKMSDSVYMNNRVRFFLNAPTWIDFMKDVDLSFGARLHGNITATIAGTPSLIIPKDARMRELAEYHNLTSLWWQDIDETTELEEVIQNVDFKSPEKVQASNFEAFITFLENNNLTHVYKDNYDLKELPIDKKLNKMQLTPPLQPLSSLSFEGVVERLDKHAEILDDINKRRMQRLENRYKNQIARIKERHKEEISETNKRIKHLEGTLNRKSARFALNFANKFSRKKK